MNILCVIPSRINSTRLPRKALLPIKEKPMIQWTYEKAAACDAINQVIVATDAQEIADVIVNIGGQIEMTDSAIPTGSERCAEVAKRYPDYDIIINLQGDEPFIKPTMLKDLIDAFQDSTVRMATLAFPINVDKFNAPASVKVITDLAGDAIYFSRAPIPYFRVDVEAPVYNHMGVYAFRRDFLLEYCTWPQTPLEITESLEQLRVIEHGFKIRVVVTAGKTLEINTPEEYYAAQTFTD